MNGDSCGRYVYCIAEGGEKLSLGNIGLDGNEVYSLPAESLCAIVHNCPAAPYTSDDEQVLHRWVISHQEVVEAALSRFGSVLPMRFDTIIQDTDRGCAEDNIRRWLNEENSVLKNKLDRLRNHEEYGVQIFWEPKTIADLISQNNSEIMELKEEIRSKSKGSAYMYKQRLERLLKQEVEKEAECRFKDYYHRIKEYVSDLKVERTKKEADKQMLMNISCLVPQGETKPLANELEKIDSTDGFSVRFTGPWPPYSFVTEK